ncbi:MAG: glutathione S-transferase family protein [Immundisolibacter sp.]|uniref:glutathione S-transferase family protein n=1 Tax=Immundisolibacter sp. TaxID=1934948 RepID=UPI003EE2B8E9
MLELYTHPMSPCAQKVRLALEEKALAWHAHQVDLAQKENLRPEYLKLNPKGVVPTLVHDGVPIIESSVICEYLEDAFPATRLRPDGALEKAEMRLWMKHVDEKLHAAMASLQWTLLMRPVLLEKSPEQAEALIARVPDKARRERQTRLYRQGLDAPDVADGVHVYDHTVQDMERALADREWLAGGSYSLADLAVLPYFQTLMQFGWQAFYEHRPRVCAWLQRSLARPAYDKGIRSGLDPALLSRLAGRGAEAWPRLQTLLAA